MVQLIKTEQNASQADIMKTFNGFRQLTLDTVSDHCSAIQTRLICSFVIGSLCKADIEKGWKIEHDESRLTIPASCMSRIKSSAILPE